MYLAKKDISNKLMILGSDRKKTQQNSAVWRKKVMSENNQGYDIVEEGGGCKQSFDR